MTPACRHPREGRCLGSRNGWNYLGQLLLAHLLGGERSAGLIPAHRHPGGVTDETVDEIDVEVGPEVALVDALIQHLDPHLALLPIPVLESVRPIAILDTICCRLDHHLRARVSA